MSKTITGFELIQEIGKKGMEFKSTNGWTLEFEEAKSIALLVLREIQAADICDCGIDWLIKEVEEAKMGEG